MTLAPAHSIHPVDCAACAIFPPVKACLSHTCPDCGAIVWGEVNAAGELLDHECTSPSSMY